MKKYFLILIISILTIKVGHSQKYLPFNLESGIWVNRYYAPNWGYNNYSIYYCKGDTNINSINYKKIYAFYHDGLLNDSSLTQLGYQGAIRNDSINKKVFLVETNKTSERKLYNFNLHIGDTIHTTTFGGNPLILFITKIDSISICGKYHRRFITDHVQNSGWFYGIWPYSYNDTITLTEGLGFSSSFLRNAIIDWTDNTRILKCYYESNNNYCVKCFPLVDLISLISTCTKEKNTNNNFKIYPNPATTQLTIETAQLTKENILIICNLNGQELIRQKLVDTKTHIDISNLTNGIYFVKLITDKTVEVRKIIKE